MSKIDGNLDNIINGTVEGWALQSTAPHSTLIVSLFIDGTFVTNGLSGHFREDLQQAGIGDGQHAFYIPIPHTLLDGKEHVIDVRVGEHSLHNSPRTFTLHNGFHPPTPSASASASVPASLPPLPPSPKNEGKVSPKPALSLEGSFEHIEEDFVRAWAWNKASPSSHISVTMIIDGEEAITAQADLRRDDLKKNKKGEGDHGIKLPIPLRFFDGKEHEVALVFTDTGKPLKNSPKTATLAAKPTFAGSLDAADYPDIRGWAWNQTRPEETLSVDIYLDDKKIFTVKADELRGDLEKAGIGDGKKAFRKKITSTLDPSRSYKISAKIAGTDFELKKSPRILKFPACENAFHSHIERREGVRRPSTSATMVEKAAKETALPLQLLPAEKVVLPDMSLAASHRIALQNVPPPTIIVPIYNAYEAVCECLEALVENTSCPSHLLLINDCSTDKRIAPLLKKYGKRPHVEVLTNKENLGFTRTVNRGMSHARHDVILLNSDTQVTPRWLENMIYAAYRDPCVATVTAISDNIGAFSVPYAGNNEMPAWLGRDEVGRIMAATSQGIYPDAPTGNGFCMYVKREALHQAGLFDHESFPRGYGEENDFCMRTLKLGWRHVVDDSTFVFHKRSASFGEEKQKLIGKSSETLRAKHPEYKMLVGDFTQSPAMLQMRLNIQKALDVLEEAHQHERPITPNALPRILYILHGGATGGTPQTNADLMQTMQGTYDTFVLDCDFERIVLKRYINGVFYEMEQWTLLRKISPLEINRDDYNAVLFEVLKRYAFELVHIRHLYKHMMTLPRVAHTLNIPVIFSFHDFYHVCPTINLVDEKGKYCGGICTKSIPLAGEDCATPFTHLTLPPLKDQWVYSWREKVREFLPYVDAFVTTCDDARAIYTRTYPEMKEKPFQVIEHGRDFDRQDHLAKTPEMGKPLRILIPGQLTQHKGADFIAELIAIDQKQKKQCLEFHFLGNLPERYRHLGEWHGVYQRHEFQDRVAEIGCHIMGIFSIWAETYCHTLSESWACGIPVVASHYGALGDRIGKHGGGWLVDIDNPQEAYKIICGIISDPKDYTAKARQSSIRNLRTTKEMGQDYAALYTSVLQARKVFE